MAAAHAEMAEWIVGIGRARRCCAYRCGRNRAAQKEFRDHSSAKGPFMRVMVSSGFCAAALYDPRSMALSVVSKTHR
jgi:hypothetical protein